MKQTIFLLTALLLGVGSAHAQNQAPAALGLYATLGISLVNLCGVRPTASPHPKAANAIGAGCSWRKSRWMIGTEFSVPNKQKENHSAIVRFSGFHSQLISGCKVLHFKDWSFYSTFGIGMNQNRFSMSDKNTETNYEPSSTIYTQQSIVLQPGFTIERVTENGMMMGLSAGYTAGLGGKADWEQEGSAHKSGFSSQPGGFYVQFKTGGLLQLVNK